MLPRLINYLKKQPNRLLLCGPAALVWMVSASVESAWQAPLTQNEKLAAQSVALSHQSNRSTGLRTRSTNSAHPLGVQILLVEPRERKNSDESGDKFAEVFAFNHRTHSTELTLVNLVTSEVVSSKNIPAVHLPLSDEEIEFSIEAVRNDFNVQTRLQQEHASLGHSESGDVLAGLQLRVSIWVPISQENSGDSRCDIERCALVSLFDADNTSYTTEPIVNLKTLEISLDAIQ